MCDLDNETADHLFGYCDFAKEVWRCSGLDTNINWSAGIVNVLETLFLRRDYDADCFAKIITTCWQIWKGRNDTIFQDKIVHPAAVVAAAAAV